MLPAITSNGGYNSSTWGTLDTSKWIGKTVSFLGTNYYLLTDYTGDTDHIIVPNEADFEKAGKTTDGEEVAINPDLTKTWSTAKSIAISKTNNQKVKALGMKKEISSAKLSKGRWYYSNSWDSAFANNENLTDFDANNLDTSNVNSFWCTFTLDDHLTSTKGMSNWDTSQVRNMAGMFNKAQNLTDLSGLANWNTGDVTDMSGMFYNDWNYHGITPQLKDLSPLANWNTSNVTDMDAMFEHDHLINDLMPLRTWNTGQVKNFGAMFYIDDDITSHLNDLTPLANWDTNSAESMAGMFNGIAATTLDGLQNWNTEKVTDISNMFRYDKNLSDISAVANWNTSNVTTSASTFNSIAISSLDAVRNWDTSKDTNMDGMFANDAKITSLEPLANWNTSNVITSASTFNYTAISSLDAVRNWDTSKDTNMDGMFAYDTKITSLEPLANWNTSNVTTTRAAFQGCTGLTNLTGIGSWNMSKNTNMADMFALDNKLVNAVAIANWTTPSLTNVAELFINNSALQYIDLSKWNFSKVGSNSDRMINSGTPVVYLGDNSTLPSVPKNSIFSTTKTLNSPIVLTTDSKLLANKSTNTIKFEDANGNNIGSTTISAFYNAGSTNAANAMNKYKAMVDNAVQTYETNHLPKYTEFTLDTNKTGDINNLIGENNHLVNYANAIYKGKLREATIKISGTLPAKIYDGSPSTITDNMATKIVPSFTTADSKIIVPRGTNRVVLTADDFSFANENGTVLPYDPVNVGTYHIILNSTGLAKYQALDSNFTWDYDPKISYAVYNIDKVAPTATLNALGNKDYDATNTDNWTDAPTLTITNDPGVGESFSQTITLDNGDYEWVDSGNHVLTSAPTNVGTYKIQLTAVGKAKVTGLTENGGNLDWSGAIFSTGTDSYTIDQANASAELSGSNSKTYDGSDIDEVNGGSIKVKLTYPGSTNENDTYTLQTGDYNWKDSTGRILASAPRDQGSYTITLTSRGITNIENKIKAAVGTGTDSSGHTISNVKFADNAVSGSAAYTIGKMNVKIVFSDTKKNKDVNYGTQDWLDAKDSINNEKASYGVQVTTEPTEGTGTTVNLSNNFSWNDGDLAYETTPGNVGTYNVKLT